MYSNNHKSILQRPTNTVVNIQHSHLLSWASIEGSYSTFFSSIDSFPPSKMDYIEHISA